MFAKLGVMRLEFWAMDALLARSFHLAGGLLLLLFSLGPRRFFIRARARHLKRGRHGAVNRERMALIFRLRMQSGRITRIAREMVNDLRLGTRRRCGFRFGGRRRGGGWLFRLHDKARPPHRRQSDEHANPIMEAGTSHEVSL